jgi:hypothetical protein
MTMRTRVLGVFVVAALAASDARAQPSDVRAAGIARDGGKLVVSLGLQDLFGARDTERLLSGLSTRVLIRVALMRDGDDGPIASATRLAEVVYDLWDEKLRVRISSENGAAPTVLAVASPNAAVEVATTLVRFPVADLAALDPGPPYHLAVRADLNPISDELVGNVRRWLSRPSGRGRSGSGDTFFGSFVSIFVNPRVDDSERQLQVTTRSFFLPPRSTP